MYARTYLHKVVERADGEGAHKQARRLHAVHLKRMSLLPSLVVPDPFISKPQLAHQDLARNLHEVGRTGGAVRATGGGFRTTGVRFTPMDPVLSDHPPPVAQDPQQ
jgi:hypothetical protein